MFDLTKDVLFGSAREEGIYESSAFLRRRQCFGKTKVEHQDG